MNSTALGLRFATWENQLFLWIKESLWMIKTIYHIFEIIFLNKHGITIYESQRLNFLDNNSTVRK